MPEPVRLDVLALAAHPDDVELCAGGTMITLADAGYRTGVVDFTRGELGTRGTPETRAEEAARAAEILGLQVRENLGIPDGDVQNTKANQRKVIEVVRRHRPHVCLINALHVRHPDHGDAARLTIDALFYAGLAKVETTGPDGAPQEPWRPHHVLHYMQALDVEPTFVVDVSAVWERRMEALLAYRTQFYTGDPEDGPATYISNPDFLKWVESRARVYGYRVGATYGEPLLYRHGPVGVTDLMAVLGRERPFR